MHKAIYTKRLPLFLPTLWLALALAACAGQPAQKPAVQGAPGGTSSAAPAGVATAIDSCELLTKIDAEAILGAAVAAPRTSPPDAGVPADSPAVSQCLYHTAGDDYKSVSLMIRRAAAEEGTGSGLRRMRDSGALGGTVDPIDGLGDDALWSHGGPSDQLVATKGRFLVIASADLGRGVPTLDVSKAIVQHVLDQLPQ
jgi:hypothetical protein